MGSLRRPRGREISREGPDPRKERGFGRAPKFHEKTLTYDSSLTIDPAGMIRPVRYAVLAFAVLGVLAIGVAVDWSTPSRAPVPAIELQPGPTTEEAVASARPATVKGTYGGRNLTRVQLPKVVRPTPRVTAAEPSSGTSGTTSTEAAEVSPTPVTSNQDQQRPTTTGGGQRGDDSADDRDRTPPTSQDSRNARRLPRRPRPPRRRAHPEPADEDDDEGTRVRSLPRRRRRPPRGHEGDDDDDDGDDDDNRAETTLMTTTTTAMAAETTTETTTSGTEARPEKSRVGWSSSLGSLGERLRCRYRRSLRAPILAWFIGVLALTTISLVVVTYEVLLFRLDQRIDSELDQERRELEALARRGDDPDTGRPFATVKRVFDVYLQRNIPSRNEVLITFLAGEPYLFAPKDVPYRLDTNPEYVALWANPYLAESERGGLSTPAGRVEYLAVPVTAQVGPGGVFVTAIFRDRAKSEADSAGPGGGWDRHRRAPAQ